MPSPAENPTPIGAMKGSATPEVIPDGFVISILPPVPLRRSSAPAPSALPRSTLPPPLPAPLPSSPLPEWHSAPTRPAPDDEESRMAASLRRWPRSLSWSRSKDRARLALSAFRVKLRAQFANADQRRQLWKPAAVAFLAALVGWGIGAKPWAHRHAAVKANHEKTLAASHSSHPTSVHGALATRNAPVVAGHASTAPGSHHAASHTSNSKSRAQHVKAGPAHPAAHSTKAKKPKPHSAK